MLLFGAIVVVVEDDIAAVDFVVAVVGAVLVAKFVVNIAEIMVVLRALEVVFLGSLVVVVRVI